DGSVRKQLGNAVPFAAGGGAGQGDPAPVAGGARGPGPPQAPAARPGSSTASRAAAAGPGLLLEAARRAFSAPRNGKGRPSPGRLPDGGLSHPPTQDPPCFAFSASSLARASSHRSASASVPKTCRRWCWFTRSMNLVDTRMTGLVITIACHSVAALVRPPKALRA